MAHVGRPDMALFLFTKAILSGEEIDIYNKGNMIRDFTYIDDITETIFRLIDKIPRSKNNFDKNKAHASSSWAPFKIFNVGNSKPVKLMDYISQIEKELGIKGKKNFMSMQLGDVEATSADTSSLQNGLTLNQQHLLKME